jgi:hypothetical protein
MWWRCAGGTTALAADGGKQKGGSRRGSKWRCKGKRRGPHQRSRRGRQHGLVARVMAALSSGDDALLIEEQRGWAAVVGTGGNMVRNRWWPTGSVQQRRWRWRLVAVRGAAPCGERKGWVRWRPVQRRTATWQAAVYNEVTMPVVTDGDSGDEQWSERSEALGGVNRWVETDAVMCGIQVGDTTRQASPALASAPRQVGHAEFIFQIKFKRRNLNSPRKNSYGVRKIPRKFVEEEDVIWNNFCNCNFFWFSKDFKLFARFQVKSSLTGFVLILPYCSTHCKSTRDPFWTRSPPWWSTRSALTYMHTQYLKIEEDIEFPKMLSVKQKPENWNNRELEIIATNSPWLKPGQVVLPSDLQTLDYNLSDMHNLTPKIWGDTILQR